MGTGVELSVIIPAWNEGPNLALLLPELRGVLDALGARWEVLIVIRGDDPKTDAAAATIGARVIQQREPGYGGALLAGFAEARGDYLLTMDADLSHRPGFVHDLWRARGEADVTIASRYVRGGRADMPVSRRVLSRVLNLFFGRGLSMPVRDLSSGFRLYRAGAVREATFTARDFDILQQILLHAFGEGFRIQEVPFAYAPREHGSSHARVLRFGLAYLRTFGGLWKRRNSILSADYDARAYDSLIPLQRYWQRSRFRHVTDLVAGQGPVLDVGCGSSRILGALPPGSVGVDVLLRKLRFARRFGTPLVLASGFHLPLPDRSFPCVLCSEVIEHVPKGSPILAELDRVLAPGGRLVLGTPDYDRREWTALEAVYGKVAPGGYADEHISHYTRRELVERFERHGYRLEGDRYILRGELILAFRKPPPTADAAPNGRAREAIGAAEPVAVGMAVVD
jgi:dolichol-phosphate mannosyltransferase